MKNSHGTVRDTKVNKHDQPCLHDCTNAGLHTPPGEAEGIDPRGTECTPGHTAVSIAERDQVGLVRHEGQTALDALWRLMNGCSEEDTAQSLAEAQQIRSRNKELPPRKRRWEPTGIARQSQSWNDAHEGAVELMRIESLDGPGDLFDASPERYEVDPDSLFKRRGLAGSPPPQPIDEIARLEAMDEPYRVYAWDAERVLFGCPRGACLMPRTNWEAGHRRCPGC